jgi:hypothetical protein
MVPPTGFGGVRKGSVTQIRGDVNPVHFTLA